MKNYFKKKHDGSSYVDDSSSELYHWDELFLGLLLSIFELFNLCEVFEDCCRINLDW